MYLGGASRAYTGRTEGMASGLIPPRRVSGPWGTAGHVVPDTLTHTHTSTAQARRHHSIVLDIDIYGLSVPLAYVLTGPAVCWIDRRLHICCLQQNSLCMQSV